LFCVDFNPVRKDKTIRREHELEETIKQVCRVGDCGWFQLLVFGL